MNIAICDDMSSDRTLLVSYLEQYSKKQNLTFQKHIYLCAEDLLKDPDIYYCSIIFLDIYMHEISGMECAKRLKEQGFSGSFVFTTTSREHVFESFCVNVLDYLVKPFTYELFESAMDKFVQSHYAELQTITIRKNGMPYLLPVYSICFIETDSHSCTIHTKGENITCSMPLSKLEDLLTNYDGFLRCHRSYIINMNEITQIHDATLTMSTGDNVLMSIRNTGKIKQQISHFFWKKAKEALK